MTPTDRDGRGPPPSGDVVPLEDERSARSLRARVEALVGSSRDPAGLVETLNGELGRAVAEIDVWVASPESSSPTNRGDAESHDGSRGAASRLRDAWIEGAESRPADKAVLRKTRGEAPSEPERAILFVRGARKAEIRGFMEVAYPQNRAGAVTGLEQAIRSVQEQGVVTLMTDILGHVVGGVTVMSHTRATYEVGWTWISSSFRGMGLARIMAHLALAQQIVFSGESEVKVTVSSDAYAATLEGIGFVPADANVAPTLARQFLADLEAEHRILDGIRSLHTKGRRPDQQLDEYGVSAALAEAYSIGPQRIWPMGLARAETLVVFTLPIVTDPLLQGALRLLMAKRSGGLHRGA